MGVVQRARRALVPRLRNTNWAYREVLDTHVGPTTRWLDLGCGHQLLPDWMADGASYAKTLSERCRQLTGIDYTAEAVASHPTLRHRVLGDVERLPFATGAFDLVTANMVVEHVADPAALLAQVDRVLSAGGVFLFHTPNRSFYQILLTLWVPRSVRSRAASLIEARDEADVFPTRYRMNTRSAIETLARRHGFAVEELHLLNSGPTASRFPPLALVEILITRMLESPRLANGRSNMIVALRKAGSPPHLRSTAAPSAVPEAVAR